MSEGGEISVDVNPGQAFNATPEASSTILSDQNPGQYLKSPERSEEHVLELGSAYILPGNTNISVVKNVGEGSDFKAWLTLKTPEGKIYIPTSGFSTQNIEQLKDAVWKGTWTVEQIEEAMRNCPMTTPNERQIYPKIIDRNIKELRLLAEKKERRLVTPKDISDSLTNKK